jgi:peptidoglycan hydrolase-like protein with peptidoglycan-binding domain
MRQTRRFSIMGMTALLAAALAVPQALAGHEENPKNGPDHSYGEDVDYPLVFPVAGANRYGDHFWYPRGDRYHHGIDIMADKMTPVVAVADGYISYYNGSGNQSWIDRYGRCCTLRVTHDDGWVSKYIHLNNDSAGTDDGQGWGIAPNIELGTRVQAGQLIGWVGDSGNAEETPPHLHFELVDPNGVIVDPYLSLRSAETGVAPAICATTDVGGLEALLDGSGLLKRDATGTAVAQLQQFLTAVGFQVGTADGVFGPKTLAGVRQFQENQGLTPDGVVGPQTRDAMARVARVLPAAPVLDANGRVLRPGARGDDVKQLQEILRLAGHDPGSIDGVFGPLTEAAIESFQASTGIDVDGKIGPITRGKLSSVLGLVGLQFCSS